MKKRNTMKKVALLVLISMLLSSFAGCGGSKKEEVVIAVWDGSFVEPAQSYFDSLTDLDVNVKVTSIEWDEYWVAVDNSLNTGNGIDIFWMHTNRFEDYCDELLDVRDVLDSEQWKDYEAEMISQFSQGERVLGIPCTVSSIGLYYNKALFDAKGMAYPTDDWTWENLTNAAIELTDEENGVYGFLSECWGEDGYYNTIFQNGGYIYDSQTEKWGYDELATQEGVQYYLDFITKHGTSPNTEDILDMDTNDLFMSGKVGMIFRGSWEIATFASNDSFKNSFDVAELPAGKIKACTSNATGFVTSKDNSSNAQIVSVMKLLASDGFYRAIAQSGNSIPADIQYRNEWSSFYSDYSANNLIDMLEYGVYMPTITGVPNWGSPEEEIMLEIFTGKISVTEGCNKLQKEYEKEKQ